MNGTSFHVSNDMMRIFTLTPEDLINDRRTLLPVLQSYARLNNHLLTKDELEYIAFICVSLENFNVQGL